MTAARPPCARPPSGSPRSTRSSSRRMCSSCSSPRSTRRPPATLPQANAYGRTETVRDPGEFAVRGGLVDLFPAGEDHGLRLDFFGDEIESVRRFDPVSQRSIDRIDGFTLLPASETLLDADSVRRFRSAYRELFGATATGDPLYQAVSDGRRIAGIDHWLPLFEEELAPPVGQLLDAAL